MNTLTLKYFMDVASGMRFFDVAEENHISQSTLSKAISQMEQELGVKLFDREHRRMILTPAGTHLYMGLRKLEPDYRKLMSEVRSYSDKILSLNVGAVPSFSMLDMGYLLNKFEIMNQNIEINRVRSYDNTQTLYDVRGGSLDLALLHQPFSEKGILGSDTVICEDCLYAVLAKNHALAKRKIISLHEIEKEHFITNVRTKNVVRDVAEVFALSLHVKSTMLNREDVLLEVASGLGISFYFKSDILYTNTSQVALCKIEEIPVTPIILAVNDKCEAKEEMENLRSFLVKELPISL